MYMVMFVYSIQYTTVYMFVYNAQHNVNEHEQLIIHIQYMFVFTVYEHFLYTRSRT